MRTPAKKQPGFSLAEVLTTLALTGITASLAVPSMQSIMRDSRQATATNTLISSLHGARSAALTRNGTVSLCASANGSQCDNRPWEDGWIVFADDNGDGRRQAEETTLDVSGALAGVTVSSAAFDNGLSFRGNGQLAGLDDESGPVRAIVCDARGTDSAQVVFVNTAGKPRVNASNQARSGLSCPSE